LPQTGNKSGKAVFIYFADSNDLELFPCAFASFTAKRLKKRVNERVAKLNFEGIFIIDIEMV
jgi:hypothetical protein